LSDGSFAISIFRESPFFIYKLSGKNISVISGNFKSVVTDTEAAAKASTTVVFTNATLTKQ